METKIIKSNKGVTLLELIVSIAVASIVLTMLMQMLVMTVQARNITYVNNRLETEAYLLAEQIKNSAFEHETQYVKITETATEITVTFVHKWNIELNPSTNAINWVEVPANEQNLDLIFHKNDHKFSLGGVDMHSPNVYYEYDVDNYTTMSVTSINGVCDPTDGVTYPDGCEDVVLTLTVFVSVYANGVLVDIEKFETTIII